MKKNLQIDEWVKSETDLNNFNLIIKKWKKLSLYLVC